MSSSSDFGCTDDFLCQYFVTCLYIYMWRDREEVVWSPKVVTTCNPSGSLANSFRVTGPEKALINLFLQTSTPGPQS